jgi:Mn2+/Fe2+ NRAMP family transporter
MIDSTNSFSKRMFGYVRQSGPGWIQAAVTLGGGTLVSALYLGVVGGFEFMWLQPLAMLCGIIMLAALSHITLSAKERPFRLAKKYVSPTLAWGWLVATIIANVVFCAAQFALGTDAIQGNLGIDDTSPYIITSVLFITSAALIWYFSGEGQGAKIIDYIIKGLVSLIVLAFMGVVITLSISGAIDWSALFSGLIPDFSALFEPTESYTSYLSQTGAYEGYWSKYISDNQRNIIIGAFGTAVGINMTFLLPYTLLKKGWGKAQRELARFDLFLGLFVPFILGSSCLIIASASQFHANKNAVVNEVAYHQVLDGRLGQEYEGYAQLTNIQKTALRSSAPQEDKQLSTMLAKRNANDLAIALEPFLGRWAQLIFGIGILAMALSTMVVHMMMNGYAVSEALNKVGNRKVFFLGGLIPAFM